MLTYFGCFLLLRGEFTVVLVTVSALKRSDVPKRRRGPDAPRPPYYLALSHGYLPRRPTWRLRIVPATYRLRYICQRGPSVSDLSIRFFVGCRIAQGPFDCLVRNGIYN